MALKKLHLSNRNFHSILFCPEDEDSNPHSHSSENVRSPGCSFLKLNSKDTCLHTFLPNFVHVIDTLNSGFSLMKAAQTMDWKKVMQMNTPVTLTHL
jgi:hypothetical protein